MTQQIFAYVHRYPRRQTGQTSDAYATDSVWNIPALVSDVRFAKRGTHPKEHLK